MLRIADTKLGKIEGLPAADPRITSFKGIPFAKPPIGNLRFRPPVPIEKWENTLKAYKFAPIAVQTKPNYDPKELYCREFLVDEDTPMSEDCLYLNIWTPAKKENLEKFPVYIWIYGGGYQRGFTSEMELDGERISRRGIVVVTICYRLNIFGFMCHPEITKENPNSPANFGLLDQRCAMKWVKNNIYAFGGDPENITIGGQSAGGSSVVNQILHGSENIFNKAIINSGIFYIEDSKFLIPDNLNEAEKKGIEFFKFCKCENLEEMRKLSAEKLIQFWEDFGGFDKSITYFLPVCDNIFIKNGLFDSLKENKMEQIPIMTGYTTDEFIKNKGEKSVILTAIEKLAEFSEKNKSDKSIYVYQFDVDIPGWDNAGKFHSSDLWFWFETLAKCWRPFIGKHYDVSRKMCNYLCNFIKNGNPNGNDSDGSKMDEWKTYDSKSRNIFKFEL